MGSVSKLHKDQIEALADQAVKAWEWQLGADVSPAVLDLDDVSKAYDSVFEAIRYELDTMAKRAGTIGHAISYMAGSFFPEIWKAISRRGVFLDFDYDPVEAEWFGEIRPATNHTIRHRLLRRRTDAYRCYASWREKLSDIDSEKRHGRKAAQVRWNDEVANAMNAAALSLLRQPTGTEKEILAQKLLGLQWFCGRRPWSETALRADFILSDGPGWADGWVNFSGHAKVTRAEKTGDEEAKAWDVPLLGIGAEEFLEHFEEFRTAQLLEPWFRPDDEEGHTLVKAALYYSTEKFLRAGAMAAAFAPVNEAGQDYKLTLHRFRDLYVSRGQSYQDRWDRQHGKKGPDHGAWAKQYLGHFGKKSDSTTNQYLRLQFLGSDPIPSVF